MTRDYISEPRPLSKDHMFSAVGRMAHEQAEQRHEDDAERPQRQATWQSVAIDRERVTVVGHERRRNAYRFPEMMSRPGESHALAKLRDADVLKIRSDYTSGVSQSVLASRFGTTQSNISLIVLRKNWRHLKETEQ